MTTTITRIDPSTLNSAPGLIAQIAAPRDCDLVFVSGQVAWDADGQFIGVGDYGAQVAQVARNIDAILTELGTDRDAIVKETIYVTGWTPDLLPVVVGGLRNGSAVPASTLIGVAALFHPDALVEAEIVVAVPRARRVTLVVAPTARSAVAPRCRTRIEHRRTSTAARA